MLPAILVKNYKIVTKGNDLVFRDIKQDPLTAEELECTNSQEVMKPCSAKAQLYKSMNLKDKSLTEETTKYILSIILLEATCFVINNGVYVGGTNKTCFK
jgi:arsenate reductase